MGGEASKEGEDSEKSGRLIICMNNDSERLDDRCGVQVTHNISSLLTAVIINFC